ncbi:MAG: HNH endonuclease [Hyphomonadaceae bacterium]|nr:HNH endonuclease [Hyphomonadaceae bacterium]
MRTLEFRPDLDSIEALSTEREALWTRIEGATFLTRNEKRAAVGYGPVDDGDELKASGAGARTAADALSLKWPGQPRSVLGRYDFGKDPNRAQPARSTGRPRRPDADGLVHQVARRRGPWPTRPSTSGPPKPGPEVPALPPPIPMIPRTPGTPAPAAPVPVPPGVTIRNQALAGGRHPDTGIPFDSQGFPDFSSVVRDTATFPHTGNLDTDRATANRQRGYSSTPPGMVWHHHQDGRTMQLVPEDIHTRTGHTGSRGIRNLPGKR